MGTSDAGTATGRKCPICGAPVEHRYRPFCSKHCAERDLARWLNGSYAVPVVELDESDLDELEDFVEGAGDASEDDDESSHGGR